MCSGLLASGTTDQYKHIICGNATTAAGSARTTITYPAGRDSSMLVGRLFRYRGRYGDTLAEAAYVLEFDIHIQQDTMGSYYEVAMSGRWTCNGVHINAKSGQDFSITADQDTLRFRRRDPDTHAETDVFTVDSSGRAKIQTVEVATIDNYNGSEWVAWTPSPTTKSVYQFQTHHAKYKRSGKHVTLAFSFQFYAGPRALWEFDNGATDGGPDAFHGQADTYATNAALPVPDTTKPYSSAVYIRGSHALNVSRADEGVKLYTNSLNAGLLPVLNGDLSLSVWFMTTDNTAQNQAILSAGSGADFALDLRYNHGGDGTLKFFHSGNTSAFRGAAWTPANNTWYHIVVTRSANVVALYVNNGASLNLGPSAAGAKVAIPASATVMAGRKFGSATDYVQGYVDDLALFDYVLSGTQIAALYTRAASGTSLDSDIDISGLPAGIPTTGLVFQYPQLLEKTAGSNAFHHEYAEERDATTSGPTIFWDTKSVVTGVVRGKASVVGQSGQSYLRFSLPQFLPGTVSISPIMSVRVDAVSNLVSVSDVLYHLLGLTNVDDVSSLQGMKQFLPWCAPVKRSDGRDDYMADVVVMSCILRGMTVTGASKRLACAQAVAALLRQSSLIPKSVFGVDLNGNPHEGRFSDLVVAPLPKGVMSASQLTRLNNPVFASLTARRFASQEMKRAKVPDDVRLRFRDQMKEMAGIRENGTTKTGCDPGWELMLLVDQSVGMSLRMFGQANSTLVLHSVSTQFETVKDFPIHFAPENRLFDVEWIAQVHDDAHYVATGMSKERFRQIQTNLREGEDEKHAYHPHTLSLFDYIRWVLFAIEDHHSSRPDLVAAAATRFGHIAARFGSQILSRQVASRHDIERRRGWSMVMSSAKPDLWDRKVYIVSKDRPGAAVLAVHDIELDRESRILRPVTNIVGFYDKRLANLTKRMAAEDWNKGEEAKWVLDDDHVDEFLCARMEEFLASDACRVDDDEGGEGRADFAVRNMTFNDLQKWTGMAGMVLRMVETVDADRVVVTSHYPREDTMFYVPYLGVCLSL
eukprot:jgi/Mesvir1/10920/Mv11462-RA.1